MIPKHRLGSRGATMECDGVSRRSTTPLEPMAGRVSLSDFKKRGFGMTKSQIRKPDRLERLILILAIAMYRAVSTGATEEQHVAGRGEKGDSKNPSILMLSLQSRPSCYPAITRWLR